MALYKHGNHLIHSKDVAFDATYTPGTATPHSGIYRCTGCGDEIASNAGNPLPSQNHKQHGVSQGAIRWQLLVYAQQQA
ncbi:protein L [Tahibacter soli]|uniref:Protein L n=1 Tax=Tahibacter soli TaxID=2983605 RepID=A0A9X4BIC7_9GAMM|nr:protein L [Tahibacter soli]MDC8010979.1 protein L [Tahibacter soli]